jgi:hypothetical protein
VKKLSALLVVFSFCLLFLGVGTVSALTASSNSVVTKVGSPSGPPPVGQGAQFAIQLVQQIQQFCGGAITLNNAGCLNSIQPPINPLAAQQIRISLSFDGIFQCVGFVQAVVAATTGQALNNGGNAINFASSIPTGYNFNQSGSGAALQPGDIPVFRGGQFGHIAYVISTAPDGSFTVAEANYCPKECGAVADTRVVLRNDPLLVGWLRKS